MMSPVADEYWCTTTWDRWAEEDVDGADLFLDKLAPTGGWLIHEKPVDAGIEIMRAWTWTNRANG